VMALAVMLFRFASSLLERRVPHVRQSVRGTKTMFFECFYLIAHQSFLSTADGASPRRFRPWPPTAREAYAA
jgi:hypothetical protein